MSGTALNITATIGQVLEDILVQPLRGIQGGPTGFIIPGCAIEESGRDELVVTEHPVEQGRAISDNAYKRPCEVTLRWSWSNSSLAGISSVFTAGLTSTGNVSYVIDVYNSLLALQNSAALFTLYTGKRVYNNMILLSLGAITNVTSEYALMTTIVCREVIIVQTQVTSLPSQSSQANAPATAATVNQGTQQPQATPPQSALSTLFGQGGAFGSIGSLF